MDDLDALVGSARELVVVITRKAEERLLAGADLGRIHRGFTQSAIGMLEEIEHQALRAATGDPHALARINDLVDDLRKLEAKLDAEWGRKERRDGP